MKQVPWDQRIARVLVRPLVATAIRPNHITLMTLLMALVGAGLIARGPEYAGWGAGIFVLSRFLDHFDGELARIQGTSSKLGYYLDYAVGGIGYAALFACMGIGFYDSLGIWSLVLGGAGSGSALISLFSNLEIDRKTKDTDAGEAVGYPGFAGFELEDGIYLIAPVTWLGYLEPFFVAAGIGASIYCLWTIVQAIRLR
jgi:archaetidylinositol phosphate synthase